MSKLLVVVDMQYDFVMPDGALYVPGAEKLLVPMIHHILQHSSMHTIYTQNWHELRSYHLTPESKEFPRHYLAGHKGAELVVPARGSYSLRKPVFDVWQSNGAVQLERIAAAHDEIEIVGVAADYCVRYAYEGFKERGFNVTVRGDLTVGIKENPFA